MSRQRHYLKRHTGWGLVYGLRPEFEKPTLRGSGAARMSDLGCLDAPMSIAGGAVEVIRCAVIDFVEESTVLRGGA